MPTLNWLGREKMTDDLRQVALGILREDRELSHHAEDAGLRRLNAEEAEEGRRGGDEVPCGQSPCHRPSILSVLNAVGHSDNILVRGDNLEALKALLPFYAARVRCIYIDPHRRTYLSGIRSSLGD